MRADRTDRLLALALIAVLGGCQQPADDDESLTVAEPAVEAPAAALEERLAPAVLARIRDREAWRDRILADTAVPSERRAEALAEVAMLYHAYDLFEPAIDDYSRAIGLAADDHRWVYLRGMARRRLNELDGAMADFARAAELTPDDVPAWVRLGEVAADRGEAGRAEQALSTALELDSECAAAHFALGQLARAAGDLAAAARSFERVLELQPETSAVRTPLGLTYRDLGREEEARAQLERAGEQRVRLTDPLLQRVFELGEGWNGAMREAGELARRGELEAAGQSLRAAIRMDPLAPASRLAWARLLLDRGDLAAAREQTELARFLSQNEVASNRVLARIAIAAENWQQAEEVLRGVTASPQAEQSDWMNLGAILERTGEAAEALEVYRELRNRHPDDSTVLISEVTQLVRLGRCAEGRDIAAAQLARRSNDALLGHAGSRLLSVCGGEGSAERALALAESLFTAAPTAGHAEAVALAHAAAGRFDEAVTWQGRAVELAGESPAGAYHEAVLRGLEQQQMPPVPWPPALRPWILAAPQEDGDDPPARSR